jgi:hypothetical protein
VSSKPEGSCKGRCPAAQSVETRPFSVVLITQQRTADAVFYAEESKMMPTISFDLSVLKTLVFEIDGGEK